MQDLLASEHNLVHIIIIAHYNTRPGRGVTTITYADDETIYCNIFRWIEARVPLRFIPFDLKNNKFVFFTRTAAATNTAARNRNKPYYILFVEKPIRDCVVHLIGI